MSVQLDTSATAGWNTGGTTPQSFNITVSAANSNRCLVVRVIQLGISTSVTITGITFNSVALTKKQDAGSGNHDQVDEWYLVAPATGTHAVTITWGGSPQSTYATAYSFYNVNQTTPIPQVGSNPSGIAASSTDTINVTTAGSAFLSTVLTYQSTASPTTATLTKTDGATDPTDGTSAAMGYALNLSSGNNTGSWSWSGSVNYFQVDSIIAPLPNTNHFFSLIGSGT